MRKRGYLPVRKPMGHLPSILSPAISREASSEQIVKLKTTDWDFYNSEERKTQTSEKGADVCKHRTALRMTMCIISVHHRTNPLLHPGLSLAPIGYATFINLYSLAESRQWLLLRQHHETTILPNNIVSFVNRRHKIRGVSSSPWVS